MFSLLPQLCSYYGNHTIKTNKTTTKTKTVHSSQTLAFGQGMRVVLLADRQARIC